jgi:pimeloyl-ACP methyl ester carboxylesterase
MDRPEFAADMSERCSDLEIHLIENTGHRVQRGQTEMFNTQILNWLQRKFLACHTPERP